MEGTATVDAGNILSTVATSSTQGFLQVIIFCMLLMLAWFIYSMQKSREVTKEQRDQWQHDHLSHHDELDRITHERITKLEDKVEKLRDDVITAIKK